MEFCLCIVWNDLKYRVCSLIFLYYTLNYKNGEWECFSGSEED